MKPMPDMNKFALACHVASEAKGWTNLKRTDAQTINLMVSENSEALEDFRNKRGVNERYWEGKDLSGAHFIVTMETWTPDRKGPPIKPCGIPIEIADTIIRIGQQCGTHKLDLAAAMEFNKEHPLMRHRTDLNEALADSTMHLSKAWHLSPEFDPKKMAMPGEQVGAYARALWSLLFFCESAGIDIWAAVEEKMAYNATREQLHGGKAI
jgi:hypothetical protein